MITMHSCGGVGTKHQLIVYIASKPSCPLCALLNNPQNNSHETTRPNLTDGEVCRDCGSMMIRTGACHTCPECGKTGSCG